MLTPLARSRSSPQLAQNAILVPMALADNIRAARTARGLKQREVADHLAIDPSSYSKLEKGLRNVAVEELRRLAALFDVSLDELVDPDARAPGQPPAPVSLADRPDLERLRLIDELDDDDKHTILTLAEKLLTNKRFKDFFAQHAGAL